MANGYQIVKTKQNLKLRHDGTSQVQASGTKPRMEALGKDRH